MPDDPTTQELIVTGHVYENYWGESFTWEIHSGDRYVRFDNDPFVQWVDVDNDNWFDYGVRDDGYGHWSYFDGFVWGDRRPMPPDTREDPQGRQAEFFSDGSSTTAPPSAYENALSNALALPSSDWFL